MARIDLWIQGVDAALLVRTVQVREVISAPFEVSIVARSHATDIDLDAASWAPASLSLLAGWALVLGGGGRSWSGLVQRIEQVSVEPSGLSTYEILLVPRLFLLTQNKDYRIFQRQTVPAIVKQLLDEWLIDHEWRLDPAAFPSLEYRVQYGESDFAFLARLCEEAGIAFFFECREGRGSVLVLSDEPSALPPRPGPPLPYEDGPNEAAEAEYVTHVRLRREGAPLRNVVRDVDFRRPGFALYGEAEPGGTPSARLARYHYVPGGFRVYTMHPPSLDAPPPAAKSAGRHDQRAGQDLAARLVLSESAQARTVSFETNALDLAPGAVVSIAGHPHPILDPAQNKLLVTEFGLELEHDKEWRATCRAVWTEPAYKPPQKTPKPVVHGMQSAVIQGPADREVYTDEHGRVKVRFFWDREAQDDEQTSCWLRVVQVWTGAGFGIWAIPRVGQEVLVGFLEGNPDEPVVVGHVPNALTPPPYPLPVHQTRTVLRTRSTPESDGYNEISFEDRKGEELLYQRAERDRETWVRRDERELVGGTRQRMVGEDEHVTVKGSRYDEVRGDVNHNVDGSLKAKYGGAVSVTIDDDLSLDVQGTLSVRVQGKAYVVALDKLLLAAADASMQSEGAFVRATPGTVFASPFVENAGVGGSGTPNAPVMPAPPVMPAAYDAQLPKTQRRLPVLGWVGGIPAVGSIPDDALICRFICECKDARSMTTGNRARQDCFAKKIRLYEQAARGITHIWSEVPYDMTQSPPVPIMSRKEPWRQTGSKPAGSRIPDIILVKDPTKPPTADNTEKVIEIKFPGDPWAPGQRDAYDEIAGGPGLVEEWGVDQPCYCSDQEEKEPVLVKISQEDAIAAAVIAAAIIVILADDAAGGFADDALLPGLVGALRQILLRNPDLFPRLLPLLAP